MSYMDTLQEIGYATWHLRGSPELTRKCPQVAAVSFSKHIFGGD
jgi:hypothetical protein